MSTSSILVLGGGFSGITAALEAAEVGHEVFLIEKSPFLGGRVSQLNKYFPKLCPPSCGLEIQFQRLKKNPNVKCITMAEITSVSGSVGNYEVTVKITPRHTAPQSVDLQDLAKGLSKDVEDEFNFGLSTRKAVYKDAPFAFPSRYVVDEKNLNESDKALLAQNEYIDMGETEKTITLNVGSLIIATGWKPYDVTRLSLLGAGKIPDCISNMQMERLASPSGPTNGKILRPSDNAAPKRIGFVQCAGSRDENHLSYCSYICCMASLKQAEYVAEQYPDAEVCIFYIDLRTPGRYDNFAKKVLARERVRAIKGKVAEVHEDGGKVWLTVEDAVAGNKSVEGFDLVVLATGMQPSVAGQSLPMELAQSEEGFLVSDEKRGIFVAGCAGRPLDVMKSAQSGTAAAMKAIQTVRGR